MKRQKCLEQPPPPSHQHSQATTTAAANTNTNTIDNLPENLILHILSFLPTQDAITTSLVSKTWCRLWTSIPSLNFSLIKFRPHKTPSATRRRFSGYINRTLISRAHSPLRTFRLRFLYKDRFKSDVDSWVRYAVENHVQELDFGFLIGPSLRDMHVYTFPFDVLHGQVRVLRLTLCHLNLPSGVNNFSSLNLKSVYLDEVRLSDQMCSDLICGCSGLEVLELSKCYGMDCLYICSKSLKELDLKYFSRNGEEVDLEIDCPNLVRLNIFWVEVKKCCFKNLFNLVHFGYHIGHSNSFYRYWSRFFSLLDQLPQIESLAVQNWWLKFVLKETFSKDFLLYNLKHLELQTCYTQHDLLGMEALLELAPNVETMILDSLHKIDADESLSEDLASKPITLSISNLKEVKMKRFIGTENEAYFLALLKKQGVVLEKIVMQRGINLQHSIGCSAENSG
ncbi:F-box/FBD/LRR-repeat protein At5g56420-like isoform X2 [Mercurialis annua]|uniref:F-box/FBD/LRR-repeat protein At5g56420-like isoform X2 n=1 Tax=Mercurialis annua TaxID=3986 RepID=UPI0021601159|nr:F-box/FBD/LRR-repeat protein At5g56420-like isoform X2 [Mercurialis annua]